MIESEARMNTSTTPHPTIRQYKYYDFVMAAFVAVLLCSNLIGAAKAAEVTVPVLGTVTFGADSKGKRKLIVVGDDGVSQDFTVPKGRHIIVTEGDYIRKGQPLSMVRQVLTTSSASWVTSSLRSTSSMRSRTFTVSRV